MAGREPSGSPGWNLAGLIGEIEQLEAIFRTWDPSLRASAEAYGQAIEAINGEAIRRLIRALKSDPAALAALKDAAEDEVVYAVLRRHGLVKASLTERVETALANVRPMLAKHGGDVELIEVNPPVVSVRFLGSCDGCAASALTFHAGVRKAVQGECPEITDIVQVKGYGGGNGMQHSSPFAPTLDANWHFAGMLADIPEGGLLASQVGAEQLLLIRRGTTVACFQNACVHMGFPLATGSITGTTITCAHHGFRYDIGSGECLTAPEMRLRPYAVRVRNERVEVGISE